MNRYVLDTSAVLALLNNEPGTEQVLEILDAATQGLASVHIPFMTLMELEYILLRRSSPAKTDQILSLVQAWPVIIEHSTEEWSHTAAKIKASTPLSVADAWICSLAQLLDAELVHKDPEYDAVSNLKSLQLPYKIR
ncbi:MAG TPA: type II toxin-antitoxin system VapC family toxin [Thermoflexia bacterium]|jgi:predicted nucleic acid-binding protein|nr:type II toxin-antitoxin system VapC family toxin [Thermoflexia bacterium]